MIVIPMAGESNRFGDAGYTQPKYMLPLAGRTLFSWSVGSFERYFADREFLFVILESEQTRAFVQQEIAQLGMATAHVVGLDGPTAGQAATVQSGLAQLGAATCDCPITIFNIDTIRPGFQEPLEFDVAAVAGYLEVFRGAGEHWSFVEPTGDDWRVRRTTEKKRISELCCTGLYQFESGARFSQALAAQRSRPGGGRVRGEEYVAPIYNRLIEAGCDVRYRVIDQSEVEFSGTPAEYEKLHLKWAAVRP